MQEGDWLRRESDLEMLFRWRYERPHYAEVFLYPPYGLGRLEATTHASVLAYASHFNKPTVATEGIVFDEFAVPCPKGEHTRRSQAVQSGESRPVGARTLNSKISDVYATTACVLFHFVRHLRTPIEPIGMD